MCGRHPSGGGSIRFWKKFIRAQTWGSSKNPSAAVLACGGSSCAHGEWRTGGDTRRSLRDTRLNFIFSHPGIVYTRNARASKVKNKIIHQRHCHTAGYWAVVKLSTRQTRRVSNCNVRAYWCVPHMLGIVSVSTVFVYRVCSGCLRKRDRSQGRC